jgi:hypothetical protein
MHTSTAAGAELPGTPVVEKNRLFASCFGMRPQRRMSRKEKVHPHLDPATAVAQHQSHSSPVSPQPMHEDGIAQHFARKVSINDPKKEPPTQLFLASGSTMDLEKTAAAFENVEIAPKIDRQISDEELRQTRSRKRSTPVTNVELKLFQNPMSVKRKKTLPSMKPIAHLFEASSSSKNSLQNDAPPAQPQRKVSQPSLCSTSSAVGPQEPISTSFRKLCFFCQQPPRSRSVVCPQAPSRCPTRVEDAHPEEGGHPR